MQLATAPMSERRHTPRVRVLKSARIVVSDKAPKIECTIRNLSEGGCLLQISTTFGVPHAFDLVMPDGGRKHCQGRWRTETRMGVAFR
jgi:PilZ domain